MPRGHVELSPSSTSRWWNCPGSVHAERGLPNPGNVHTQAGTAAHALAETAWAARKPAKFYLNTAFAVDDDLGGEVHIVADQEMVDAVQTLLDVYALEADGADRVWVEQRGSLDALTQQHGLPAMGGSLDFGVFKHRWIRVTDFKYGRGVVVEATNNLQGRTYALQTWLALIAEASAVVNIEGIAVTIVQPRAFHPDGPVRTELIPIAEFKLWAKELMARAKATLPLDAPLIPGDQCKFCRAKSTCPALRDTALAVAQIAFSDLVIGPPAIRSPTTVTPDDLARTLVGLDLVEEWATAMRARAMADLEAGRPVESKDGTIRWALKPKRGQRKFVNPEAVLTCLDAFGLSEVDMHAPRELLSPARLEKVAKKAGVRIPADLIVAESSGMTLCRVDEDVALLPRSSEFATTLA